MNTMDWPQWIVATTVSTYWACVICMSVRSRIAFKTPSGSLPKTKIEKAMWLVWLPVIVAWISLCWNSENLLAPFALESNFAGGFWLLVWVAALTVLTAFGLTVRCWLQMGSNWTMAVRPDKETELITEGVFSLVRHPIYALSLSLMIGSLVVVFNFWMACVAMLHSGLLILKSWNEERYLIATHGQQYRDYLNRTNRFIPMRAVFRRLNSTDS